MGPLKTAKVAVAALEDIKGRDIMVFNVAKMTAMFDHVIIVSGDSNRQLRALANNVCDEVRKAGGRVTSTEGEQTGEWVLVDLGSVIVHVMQPAIREYYNLEEIWGTPRRIKAIKAEAAKPKKAHSSRAAAPRKAAAKPTTKRKAPARKTAARKTPVRRATARALTTKA
jgi:ribosome-associated protein